MMAGTVAAGVVTTMRSGTPGSSPMDLKRGKAEDAGALRIHGPDRTAEGAAHQVLQDGAADAAGAIGGADDGDRFGSEDGGQRTAPDADEIVRGIDDERMFPGRP